MQAKPDGSGYNRPNAPVPYQSIFVMRSGIVDTDPCPSDQDQRAWANITGVLNWRAVHDGIIQRISNTNSPQSIAIFKAVGASVNSD